MGYHDNEEQHGQLIKDGVRFLNDRARLEHALRKTLVTLGAKKHQIEEIVNDVRAAKWYKLNKFLKLNGDRP
jgi:SOS response regulatory protein OraA/RecX